MSGDIHDVLIVGAGQGGLGLSFHLCAAGIGHVVLDRGRVGEAWRRRWDSFCLVTPNWSIRLPGAVYSGGDPEGFMPRDDFVRYMEEWATGFGAPVRGGVEVQRLQADGDGFVAATSAGPVRARQAVVATATYQHPRRPKLAGTASGRIVQISADDYRCPAQLPDGAVVVVGSGQTGCQLAEDLHLAGRDVYLCVGRAGRLPRRYRGRDCIAWQRDMGLLDRTPDMLVSPADRFRGDPHLSGRDGGHTISLYEFHRRGITLLDRLDALHGETARFGDEMAANLAFADDFAGNFFRSVDEHAVRTGLDAPDPTPEEKAGARPSPDWLPPRVGELDLEAAGVSAIVWATGYTYDFSWIRFPVFDEAGYPVTDRGRTSVPGLSFIGLNWMHKRKSGILYGVEEDAGFLARHVIASAGAEVE